MTKAIFMRKANTLQELKEATTDEGDKLAYVIEKTIIVSDPVFDNFCDNLLWDNKIVIDNQEAMWWDNDDVMHVIMVTSDNADVGILVESEDYSYARYSAIYYKSDNEKKRRPGDERMVSGVSVEIYRLECSNGNINDNKGGKE